MRLVRPRPAADLLVQTVTAAGLGRTEAWPYRDSSGCPSILGVAQLDGDPAMEVVVHAGGETIFAAGIIELDRAGRLRAIRAVDGEPFTLAYNPHSMACAGCRAGVACRPAGDGRPDIVSTWYGPLGANSEHKRTDSTYRIADGVATDTSAQNMRSRELDLGGRGPNDVECGRVRRR